MTMEKKQILAAILSGGAGRRMGGRQKALIEVGGIRLIDRAIACARGQCGAIALVVGDSASAASSPFASLGLTLLADALPGRAGPLAGVLSGLDHAAQLGLDAVLTLPCDCPFLPGDLISRLSAAGGLACAASAGRTHPTVALWPSGLREALRQAVIDESLRKVAEFQRRFNCVAVEWPIEPHDPFFNVNTPDDLVGAEFLARGEVR
jgi:molybdenum cofactor guanylyltransferase